MEAAVVTKQATIQNTTLAFKEDSVSISSSGHPFS